MTRHRADPARLRDGDAHEAADLRLARQLQLLAGDDRVALKARPRGERRGPALLMSLRLAALLSALVTVGGGASATAVLLVRRWHRTTPVSTVPAQPAAAPAPAARLRRPSRHTEAASTPDAPPAEPAALAAPVSPPTPPAPRPVARRTALAAPPPPTPVELAQEADLLRDVLLVVRDGGDSHQALALLDTYAARFPHGALRDEAAALRGRVLLRLGNQPAALAVLESLPLGGVGDSPDLIITRGELRSLAGRCREALIDFAWALDRATLRPADRARALYGRASCRARSGDPAGAEQDRERYLREFPDGPAAARLRRP